MGLLPLDGPSLQGVLSVGTVTVVEAKIGTGDLDERKVVTLQPLTGKIYLYFGFDTIVPSAATVAANGMVVFKNSKESYEASNTQKVYILAVSGTVNVAVIERA